MTEKPALYRFGPFALDVENHVLLHCGVPLKLGPKVTQTLIVLVSARGAVVSKHELIDAVWPESFVEEANLTQSIYVLRKTLRAHWNRPAIVTLPRRGYRFDADVVLYQPATGGHPNGVRRGPRLWGMVALCVVAVLLTSADTRRTAAKPQFSSHTQRLYALGRYYWDLRTRRGLTKSVGYFAQVTKLEPKSPLGYSGLADAYLMLMDHGFGDMKTRRYEHLARTNARRALGSNAHSAEALTSAAMIALSLDHDTTRTDGGFRAAIEIDPTYASAHHWYGTSLATQGRLAAAHRELEIAETLNPTSSSITSWLAADYYFYRDYKSAISYNRQALELDPERTDVLYTLGLAYEQSGNYREAIAVFHKLQRTSHGGLVAQALLAHTYASMGDFGRARRMIASVRRLSRSDDFSPVEFAVALIAVRQRNDALRWLRTAHSLPLRAKMWLALDPRMDPVRGDRRFKSWAS